MLPLFIYLIEFVVCLFVVLYDNHASAAIMIARRLWSGSRVGATVAKDEDVMVD